MSERMVEGLEDLSPRLREVLFLVAEGKTNQEIGDELSIKMETARNHVHLLARRIGVSGTPENRNVRVKLIRWLFMKEGLCVGCMMREEEIEVLEAEVRKLRMYILGNIESGIKAEIATGAVRPRNDNMKEVVR